MKLILSKTNPPLGGLITVEYLKSVEKAQLDIEWGEEMSFYNGKEKQTCLSSNEILRAIACMVSEEQLYGENALEKTETDQWLTFAVGSLVSNNKAILHLNKCLAPVTYLVGKRFTIADSAIFSALFVSKQWQSMLIKKDAPEHVLRWYHFIMSQEWVTAALSSLPCDVKISINSDSRQSEKLSTSGRLQEGKFIELPGAEMGKVIVRFPPEASGYLHIGHAKAALLNQYYQQAFKGKLIMRFDDTNPAKENVDFEKVILEDIDMLQIKPDMFTHTSQYFDLMLEYCEKLLKVGKAYVDDTEPENMKLEREQRIESANRNNTYEKNVTLWNEMTKGSKLGQKCCVRAKIDMQSPNGCMRDPTIYRCKNEPHPRTGTLYKVYPTYDFACPIVDAIEGVTHTLRTMEYHDRDAQFYWFIDALGLRKPYIWEYSRLSMTNTVLSKRKLAWFVEQKIVDGWDDPRFPTVRGVLRRGMTVEGLKQFIVAQGSSRSVVFMEWDKIWAFNKKVIDPVAPRYTALEANSPVSVTVKSVSEDKLSVAKHPKNSDIGMKDVWIGSRILIDRADAELLKENENTTFINWGNLLIKSISRQDGRIVFVEAEPNLDNKDYKKTLKLTWLAETNNAEFTPTYCIYFDHIISKALLGKDEDFKKYVGHTTRVEFEMLGDPELRNLRKGDIIQLQRRGYFIVDVAYQPSDLTTCKEQAIILFNIPDGHTKENLMATAFNKIEEVKQETPPPADILMNLGNDEISISEKIRDQGDKIRVLKSKKANKANIETEVKILLSLKTDYKKLTGKEWKPGVVATKSADSIVSTPVALQSGDVGNVALLSNNIAVQGDKVRLLKSEKVDKGTIDGEVKILLSMKSNYKALTGKEWKPEPVITTASKVAASDQTELLMKIPKQGDKVRDLKSKKADKAVIDAELKLLLSLKAHYKTLTGKIWTPENSVAVPQKQGSSNKGAKQHKIQKQPSITEEAKPVAEGGLKKQTRLGMEAKKEENLSEWYSQVITKGEMIEYYDVSGCYIFRPWSFAIWESIKDWLDCEIKKLGVQNCYFPIFVSQSVLEKEKTHIADFAPEVAWVTRSGSSEMAEPIAVRPTSETVMYPAYSKWIQSFRDLPIKLNQWNNVVRWEFKHPQPFLRTREFLWQEGHTAYAQKADAEEEVLSILDLYARIYSELLAIPVVKGRKTEKEKFAGGDYTYTVEAFVSASGRAIQGATSHHLGQNFSKMFDIVYEDAETQEKQYVYQNSWGITTRTIGVMIMVHADNQGLILPPRVASVQIVIVPCGINVKLSDCDRLKLKESCIQLESGLIAAGLNVKGDYRDNYSPGWKFNHWELKGVPIRVELGPKDIQNGQLVAVRRDTGEKVTLKRSEAIAELEQLLNSIQHNLYAKACKDLTDHTIQVTDWQQFAPNLDKKNIILAPFCGETSCEDRIKADSASDDKADPNAPSMGAKSLCIPIEQPAFLQPTDVCIHPDCKNKPLFYTLFGRSY